MKVHIERRIRPPRKRNQIIDVVCGMRVNPIVTPHNVPHRNGITYYFCSAYCKEQFEAAPAAYIR